MNLRSFGAGLAGGAIGGALVGLAEALASWTHAHGAGELPPIAWALAAYGSFGAALGLGAGLVAMILGTDGFALALAGVIAALGFVVGRFRIVRDVFLEQMPHGLVPMLVQVGALVGTIVLAVVIWRLLRGVTERRALLTRPIVALGTIVVLAGVASVALRAPAAAPPVSAARGPARSGAPNVILFMVDTLRADHLSCYGYTASRTPNVDAMAADGIRFAHTFSQASWTRPSVATILTGLYPSSHGAVHKADILPDRVDTLAEVLSAAGYYTAGFANNANVSPGFNFNQGFADYRYLAPDFFFHADEPASQLTLYGGFRLARERFFARRIDVHNYYQPADVVVGEVKQWLDTPAAKQRPFFLFVHFMDAHDPYFVHPFNGEGYARVANPNPPADVVDKYRRLYDSGVAYMDEHLGTLIADLKKRGLYDDTMLVLTGDHGEEFQEHGGWWHGTTLYDEQIHVPLVVKPARGGARGRVIEEFATSLDIAPTIITAGGGTVPPAMQGHVLPLDSAEAPARDSVFSEEDLEGNVLQAVRGHEWKLITANPGNPRGLMNDELYDVKNDPREKQNLSSSQPVQLETSRAQLGRSLLEARAHAGATGQHDVDSVTRDRLKALGYVN
jgi:arylsulfatase A-like enzyme